MGRGLSFLAVLFLYHNLALAAVGIQLPTYETPSWACMIKYYAESGAVTETCSASLVSPQTVLLAGHCSHTDSGEPERVAVLCPGQPPIQVESYEPHPQFNDGDIQNGLESHRAFDLSLYHLASSAEPSAPLEFAKDRAQFLEVIETAAACAVFGFGGVRYLADSPPQINMTMVEAETIHLRDDNVVQVDGLGPKNTGLVVPGDSGGALACRRSILDPWVQIAVVSGRDYDYQSYFAPTFEMPVENQPGLQDVEPLQQGWLSAEREVAIRWGLPGPAEFPAESWLESRDAYLNERNSLFEERLRQNVGDRLNIPLFSTVTLDPSQMEIEFRPDFMMSIARQGPVSTVDQATLFRLDRVENGRAYGQLRVWGFPEYFGCLSNVLCSGGTYENVSFEVSSLWRARAR